MFPLAQPSLLFYRQPQLPSIVLAIRTRMENDAAASSFAPASLLAGLRIPPKTRRVLVALFPLELHRLLAFRCSTPAEIQPTWKERRKSALPWELRGLGDSSRSQVERRSICLPTAAP